MAKELFVSSSPHETKVAVFEDDQLVEVYFEREADSGLVGGIYKGRVNRVLPGMQSAFVNIGLERDAFLYVSDFVEDEEEYDKIFTDAEARATRFVETGNAAPAEAAAAPPLAAPAAPVLPPAPASEPAATLPVEATPAAALTVAPVPAEKSAAPPPPASAPPPPRASGPGEYRRHDPRGRGRFRRGGRRDYRPPQRTEPPQEQPSGSRSFELLPGESLAKYRDSGTAPAAPAPPESNEPAAIPARRDESSSAPIFAGADTGGAEAARAAENDSPVPEREPTETAASGAEHAPAPPTPTVEVVDSESTVIFTPVNVFGTAEQLTVSRDVERKEIQAASESGSPAASEHYAEPSLQADMEGDASAETKETVDLTENSEGAPGDLDELDAAADEEAGAAEAGASQELSSAPATPAGGEPTEKKYTLREPHERPRFAPRRRRGRRGGMGRRGERPESSRVGNQQSVQISDVLKEGQEIIVQIAKEPLGSKGARITSHVALPGRYLVYMPTISHIGVSRKIGSEEERLRLRNIILENRGPLTGGFIVRTAGAGRSEDEFKTDLRFLSTLWGDIRAKAERMRAPALLHRDLNLVQRILRDLLSPDFKQVRVDSEADYERCVEFVNQSQPSLVGHVKLYTRKAPMFEEFGVQQEIDQALRPKVWLKSGGYIVINQTEALVAIDVNTGKFVGKTNRLEDTILKTNIDAINEIVRQIRLRDLGGILVIDFIDMDERKNRFKVVQALEEALRRDRAPTKVISFNDFGLVAITRKRVKQSLERTLCQPCSYCSGAGWVKSVTTVCYEILGEVKKMAAQLEGETITLRVHPDVAQALKSKQGALLSELEALTHKDIFVKGDSTVHQERFEIY